MINAKIIVLIIPKAILLLKFLPNVIKYVLITLAGPSVEKSFKTSIKVVIALKAVKIGTIKKIVIKLVTTKAKSHSKNLKVLLETFLS